jgi:hypothetical protein
MDRHPDEVIVWLDVDCIVHGDLSPLADNRGDVAFRMHSKFRRHHKGARFRAQSGTMVFRPTPEARQYRRPGPCHQSRRAARFAFVLARVPKERVSCYRFEGMELWLLTRAQEQQH